MTKAGRLWQIPLLACPAFACYRRFVLFHGHVMLFLVDVFAVHEFRVPVRLLSTLMNAFIE